MSGKILAAALFAAASAVLYADTMWLTTPDFSYSRRMIVQHCGDDAAVDAGYRIAAGRGDFSVLRIGGTAYLNSRGLAVQTLELDSHLDTENRNARFDARELAAHVAARCADAPAAVRMIARTVAAREFRGGAVFFAADPRRAFAVECSPGRFDAEEIRGGYCVYAPNWRLPALFSVLHLDCVKLWEYRCRETVLGSKLAECLSSNGVSVAESVRLARRDEVFGKHNVHLGPYSASSSSSVLAELDDEFPETMSALYVSLGSPRHSPHLPVALGVARTAALPDGAWRELAERLRAAAGDDPGFAAELENLEGKLFSEFDRVRREARHKLRRSGRREALRMLAELQKRQQRECLRFMEEKLEKYRRSKVRR